MIKKYIYAVQCNGIWYPPYIITSEDPEYIQNEEDLIILDVGRRIELKRPHFNGFWAKRIL